MGLLLLLIRLLTWVIIVDAILSWIPSVDRRHPVVVWVRKITNPILSPIRSVLPPERTGYIDLSPLIAIVLLNIVYYIVFSLSVRV